MDIRVAWKDAKIGFVFARRGIVPDACSSFYLPQLIGKSRTLSLFLTGEVLPASHRLFDGLFHTVGCSLGYTIFQFLCGLIKLRTHSSSTNPKTPFPPPSESPG